MRMPQLTTVRLRSRLSEQDRQARIGKVIGPADVDLLAVGPCRVLKPNGDLLLIYLPGALNAQLAADSYEILHSIRGLTDNRGDASGSQRVGVVSGRTGKAISRAKPVMSSVIGNFDRMGGRYPYCRTTAWTGQNTEQFGALYPLFRNIAGWFKLAVPDRYAVQMAHVEKTDPAWRIADTPFSTMTVNNTYPTGVHQDAGDLHEGFSCLAVLRRGHYTGGWLTFTDFRVGIDMQDRDLVLMDAHEWHGNTVLWLNPDDEPTPERISLVLYYRTNMKECGTAEQELAAAKRTASKGIEPTAADTVVLETQ